MAITLDFDIRSTGISDQEKISRIIAEISKNANVTTGALKVFELALRADVAAGNSLTESLKAVSSSSSVCHQNIAKLVQGMTQLATTQAQATQATTTTTQANTRLATSIVGIASGVAGFNAILRTLHGQLRDVTTGFYESARETQRFAERLGLSITQAKNLQNVAYIAGVNVKTLEASARILSNALDDSTGAGKKAAAALHQLGIATLALSGNSREEGEVLTELIDRLSKIPDVAERNRIAFATLGRGAKEIMPLITELDELKKRVNDLGISYDEDIIRKGAEADKAFKQLGLAFKYLKDTIGAGLAVPISFVVTGLAKAFTGANSTPSAAELEQNSAREMMRDEVKERLAGRNTDLTPFIPLEVGAKDAAGASRFSSRYAGTEEGMQGRISELQADLAKQRQIASSGDVSVQTRAIAEAQYNSDLAQIRSLQARIDKTKELQQVEEQLKSFEERAFTSGYGPITQIYHERDQLVASGANRSRATDAANVLASTTLAGMQDQYGKLSSRIQNEGFKYFEKQLEEDAKELDRGTKVFVKSFLEDVNRTREIARTIDSRRFSDIRSTGEHTARLAGINIDNPVAAAQAELTIRQQIVAQEWQIIQAHSQLYNIDAERYRLQKEADDAQLRFEEQIAAMRKRENEQFASTFANGIMSIQAGQGGQFFKSLATNFESTVLTNIGRKIAPSVLSRVPKFGGWLTEGTPFGQDAYSMKLDTANQWLAQITANTAALNPNMISAGSTPGPVAVPLGSGSGGVGLPFGLGSIGGVTATPPFISNLFSRGATYGKDVLGIPIPSIGSGATIYTGMAGLATGAKYATDLQAVFTGTSRSGQTLTTSQQVGAGIGAAGIIATGTTQAYQGFKRGGVKGDLQGVSATAGTIAAFDPEPISKGILAGVALVTGIVSNFFGNGPQNRDNQIKKLLGNAHYIDPLAINQTINTSGNYTDFDQYGNVRGSSFRGVPMISQPYQWYHDGQYYQYPGQVYSPFQNPNLTIPAQSGYNSKAPVINVNVHAPTMDSKSFIDNAPKIMEAVTHALSNSGSGQRFVSTMKQFTGQR